jgi:CRISPR-associated exonuclease Cas4
MFDESDLLPISGLQHLAFCERQWGLIHLEQVWSENVLTAQGRVMHERAHEGQTESRGNVRIARAVRLRSLRLGLTGVADVVEFHRVEPAASMAAPDPARSVPVSNPADPSEDNAAVGGLGLPYAVALPDCEGRWRPMPVEYKRGRPKSNRCDEIQLCAQAICLEEMLECAIAEGALFYGQTRRRTDVRFDDSLRLETERMAARMHELFVAGITPPGVYEKKCKSCSLLEVCRPERIQSSHSATRFLARQLADMDAEES